MRLTRRREKAQVESLEAHKANADSEEMLIAVQENGKQIREVVEALRRLRERNNFAEAIRYAMSGGK